MRMVIVLAIASLCAFPAWAGKLDLNLYVPASPIQARKAEAQRAQISWTPGNPLDLRGESVGVQALSHAGYATMGALGLAESLRGGGGREATAAAVGFGLIGVIQAWGGWSLWKDVSIGGSAFSSERNSRRSSN